MPACQPNCFGYMPKTNQIAGKAYHTSLESKIEDLNPGSACPAPTKNEKNKYENFTLIEYKRSNVNTKVKKSQDIFFFGFNKCLKASE